MNHERINAEQIAELSRQLNLQPLLDTLLLENDPQDVRRNLLAIYFDAVNDVISRNLPEGSRYHAILRSLQSVIEAIDKMDDVESIKHLDIRAV